MIGNTPVLLFAALIMLAAYLQWVCNGIRRYRASIKDDSAAMALQQWLNTHPDQSPDQPRCQQLIRERIQARRAYIAAWPKLGKKCRLISYLQGYLDNEGDSGA